MIEYKEIYDPDYWNLADRSGYYKITFRKTGDMDYSKDSWLHRADGPARIRGARKEYWLVINGVPNKFGSNNPDDPIHYILSDEYWIKYQKLMVFQ